MWCADDPYSLADMLTIAMRCTGPLLLEKLLQHLRSPSHTVGSCAVPARVCSCVRELTLASGTFCLTNQGHPCHLPEASMLLHPGQAGARPSRC